MSKIQLRRGTAAQWTSANPVLSSGEVGFETDTNKFKIGDGSTAWASLSYFSVGGVDQTLANTSDATSHTVTLSGGGGSIKLVEGANITLTTTGDADNGVVTIASTGGGGGLANVVEDLTPQLGGDLDANGFAMVAADHGTATDPQVVNVVYGTGSPPAAGTTPIGTLFIQYLSLIHISEPTRPY